MENDEKRSAVAFAVLLVLTCLVLPAMGASTFKVQIPAGPIWSNNDAEVKGPMVAAAHFGTFTGNWTTVVEDEMSVVEVELPTAPTGPSSYTMDVPAGPIWNNEDAKIKCPVVCASYGGTWNGQWTTVVEGKMSVCGCTFKFS